MCVSNYTRCFIGKYVYIFFTKLKNFLQTSNTRASVAPQKIIPCPAKGKG